MKLREWDSMENYTGFPRISKVEKETEMLRLGGMRKKGLALLLSIIMVLGLFPLSALADGHLWQQDALAVSGAVQHLYDFVVF